MYCILHLSHFGSTVIFGLVHVVTGKPMLSYFANPPANYIWQGPGTHEKLYSKYVEQELFGVIEPRLTD